MLFSDAATLMLMFVAATRAMRLFSLTPAAACHAAMLLVFTLCRLPEAMPLCHT